MLNRFGLKMVFAWEGLVEFCKICVMVVRMVNIDGVFVDVRL